MPVRGEGKRDVWVLPALRSRAVAPFLAKLAPSFAMAAKLDLRLRVDDAGNLLVLCPLPEAAAELQAIHGRLIDAFEAAGRRGAELENLPAQSRDIAAEPPLVEGVMTWIWQQVGPVPDTEIIGQDDGAPVLRAVLAGDSDAVTGPFAALVRRSRDARFLISGQGVTLLDLSDDPARGSTLAGLRAEGLPAGITLLSRDSLAAMALWLPEGMGFAVDRREVLTSVLNGLIEAGLLSRAAGLHLLPDAEGSGQAILLPPEPTDPLQSKAPLENASVLAHQIDPPQKVDEVGPPAHFSVLTLAPDAEAQAALNARLNDRTFPLGYRISLAAVGSASLGDEDIERLRSEIEEREARIALIQALDRPQLRLLRFTDAQLPALVDGLRKMPRALRENAGLKYASAHAAGQSEPTHFVMYDPEVVQFDGVLPEYYWRAVTEDQPIGFWLDPHAEEARNGDPDEPRVFVPHNQRILPYIDSFGASLKGTLQLVLGRLFADGSAVLGATGAVPAFVFRDIRGEQDRGADEIGVELLDLSKFAPLRLSLRWINEHILASSPRIADPEDRRELAESLYAGQLAHDMRGKMQAEVGDLRIGWAQAQEDMLSCLDDMAAAVAREVGALRQQMEAARRFVDLSRERLTEITGSLNGLGAAVGGLDAPLGVMADGLSPMAAHRVVFLDQYQAEYETSEKLLEDTDREIAALRERMAGLAADLARG
jgi:hypothetical protein